MDNLKPCPFCGGKAEIVTQKVTEDGISAKDVYIECTECGIRGSTFRVETTKNINDWWLETVWNQGEYKEMVRKWNRRVKIKEKKKPVWEPEKKTNGIKMFSFCPACGNLLHTVDVNGELHGDNFCSKCGAAIKWEE